MNDTLSTPLSGEALSLLREARFDSRGKIWFLRFSGDVIRISTNGKHLVNSDDGHLQARWESAVQELEENNFIEAVGHGRKCFVVTKKGYERA